MMSFFPPKRELFVNDHNMARFDQAAPLLAFAASGPGKARRAHKRYLSTSGTAGYPCEPNAGQLRATFVALLLGRPEQVQTH